MRSRQLMNVELEYILRINPQCKKKDKSFEEYDSCMTSIQQIDIIDIDFLNEHLK